MKRMLLILLIALPLSAGRAQMDMADMLGTLSELSGGLDVDITSLRAPTPEEWQKFWGVVNTTLASESLQDLADLLPYAGMALNYLDRFPEAKSYADWLRQRMDYLDMAAEVLREDRPPVSPPAPGKVPAEKPAPPPARKAPVTIVPPPKPSPAAKPAAGSANVSRADRKAMDVDRWVRKIEKRPPPERAARYVPLLKPIFRQEGVPEQLVWLAEVESSFDPAAKSPVGALGLYQFMPATAQRFGLSLKPKDERLVPERSAVAAAKYLRFLYGRFQSWPLALAAYNAGEGRVGKLMSSRKASTFEGIADHLPAETRMYVPKVAAVVKVREGADLTRL